MAISNMQQARQLRAGGGIMDLEPRQGYFLGKAVKKIGRGLKKVVKSPLGKAALIGAGAYFGGGGGNPFTKAGRGAFGSNKFGALLKRGLFGSMQPVGPASKNAMIRKGGLRGLFSKINPFTNPDLTFGQKALIGGGLAATALPFLMGGGDEEEEIVETFEKTPGTITDIVAQARSRDPSLRFLPQNAYTQAGFFGAADGGMARTGYAMGGPTEDVMVENVDTQEVVSNPDPMAELNMLSIELFGKPLNQLNETERGQLQELIQSRMQEQAGNRVMAESGGMMDYMSSANPMADSYIMEDEDIVNMYRPGGDRQMAAGGGIMDAKRGFVDGPGGYAGNKGKSKKPNMAAMTSFEENIPAYLGAQVLPFLPYLMAMKDGGRIPAQEGGIMDLGGMEKDYREEGGFVPIGGEERADDVPARLSKNEFVFTADAVRNAGGGDIDRGAEVMENLMNNLEQGGEVSEESQGMNPAQEMFDTAQMLESRIA
jgi:hypothetical protein